MFGPLVLAVRMGAEGLTAGMIQGGMGPQWGDEGYPMPVVDLRPPRRPGPQSASESAPPDPLWFERIEGTREFPLVFRTKGRGPTHTLVPLNRIMDERYSVYVRNESA
jgi:hypothetical protein